MLRTFKFLLIPAFMFAAVGQAATPANGNLDVAISGLHSTKGTLLVCLWKDKAGFPTCQKSATAIRKRVAITATALQVGFAGIDQGQYAVTVHHDENNDGKMQSNFIGMPKEGVGVSNNPGGMPGFAKSLFTVGSTSNIAIRMKYLFE